MVRVVFSLVLGRFFRKVRSFFFGLVFFIERYFKRKEIILDLIKILEFVRVSICWVKF